MGGLLLCVAVLFVLFKAWHGWRLGVVRQLMNVLAALIAGAVGLFVARFAGAPLGHVAALPERALGPLGGVVAGLAVYLILVILSAVLFKRTKDQSFLPFRLIYGFGGMLIGVAYGVFLITIFAIGLRLTGTLAETKLAMENAPYLAASRPLVHDNLSKTLASLKRGTEQSRLGALLSRVDPIPASAYLTLAKFAKVASDSRAIERLIASPELRPVMEQPKVAAALRTPELNQIIVERRYAALLTQPQIVAAIDDPEVAARLRAVDWNKALDRALRPPGSGPQ